MSQRLNLLLQMLEKTPKDPFTLFATAKEYEKMDDSNRALELYLQLRDADPGYVGLYYHLGKLFYQIGREQEALQAYRTGMQVAKKVGDALAWSELNGARLEIDDSDEDF